MNRKIGIAAAGVLLLMLLFWRTDQNSEPEQTESVLNAPSKRKTRTGPRTPPTTVQNQDDGSSAPPIRQQAKETSPATKQTRDVDPMASKVELYLEHLDAIEDPTVADLTYLGELAFDANDPASAYDHYLEVIEGHADDPMAPFALYKFAWVEYNLGEVDAAIEDMNLMIEWIEGSDFPLDQTLRESAYSDLELFQRHSTEQRSP